MGSAASMQTPAHWGGDLQVQLICNLLPQGFRQLGSKGFLEGLQVLKAGRAHWAVQLQQAVL